jgi:hypothetical protein
VYRFPSGPCTSARVRVDGRSTVASPTAIPRATRHRLPQTGACSWRTPWPRPTPPSRRPGGCTAVPRLPCHGEPQCEASCRTAASGSRAAPSIGSGRPATPVQAVAYAKGEMAWGGIPWGESRFMKQNAALCAAFWVGRQTSPAGSNHGGALGSAQARRRPLNVRAQRRGRR